MAPVTRSIHNQVFRKKTQAKKMTLTDAKQFIEKVKREFGEDSQRYRQFVDTMCDFEKKKITVVDVLSTMNEVFSDNEDLHAGFNYFLP